MNDLMNTSTLSMTSREIAEVARKEHRNVTADIRNMLAELKIDALTFQHIYKDSMNRDQIEYVLDKELTITLTSGYSATQRHAIIKRWLELEGGRPMMTRLELAKEQVRLIEELEAAEEKVATLNAELDYSHEWATIKRMEHATGEKYDWRKLKAGAVEIDCPRRDVFDANYTTVKSYHADLWMHCYGLDLKEVLQ